MGVSCTLCVHNAHKSNYADSCDDESRVEHARWSNVSQQRDHELLLEAKTRGDQSAELSACDSEYNRAYRRLAVRPSSQGFTLRKTYGYRHAAWNDD